MTDVGHSYGNQRQNNLSNFTAIGGSKIRPGALPELGLTQDSHFKPPASGGRSIGFLTEWPKDNIPALLQMLVDEINEKTAYSLSQQPWRATRELQTRIRVAKLRADTPLDREPIALARKRGIELSAEAVKAISGLIGQKSPQG